MLAGMMPLRICVLLMGLSFNLAATEPFGPLARTVEPQAPMLTDVTAGDVLRDAKVTASHHEEGQPPEFANNGNHDYNIIHWGSKQLPAWLQFELPEARSIAQLNLWIYAPGARVHTFTFEGSDDGEHWRMLVDRRTNAATSTMHGFTFVLPEPVNVRFLRLNVLSNSKSEEGAMIFEVDAYARPAPNTLVGSVSNIHRRYNGGDFPAGPGFAGSALSNEAELSPRAWSESGWRGERVSGKFVVWTQPERLGLRVEVRGLRPSSDAGQGDSGLQAQVRFIKQVRADDELVGDLLGPATRLDMPAGSYRELWLSVDVPREAMPGVYTGELVVRADDCEPLVFPLSFEVLPVTLPAAADKKFHLDLWQHPWAIARWHDVAPWSDEHFRLMRPYLTELASAGQKIITTTITHRPWGRRDYDDYHSMVEHVRQADGSWTFDYTKFDRYVEFAMDCGITGQINCYSLLTWSSRLYYTDAATGDEKFMSGDPTGPEFAEYWAPFLEDFERHLAAKGWLQRARLAIDEAPAPMMEAVTKLVREHAAGLRLSLAGNQAPSHYTGLDLAEFSIILDHASDELLRDIANRRADGRITTFYVCLDPKRPNTFVASPPAEALWIGYYTAVNGYDGFLRWAWTTWPEDPLRETSYWGHPYHRYLPAGDTFLIYPGPRSSVRWELLRDGFEEWEKLRLLREAHGGELPVELAKLLERFRDPKQLGDDATIIRDVEAMRAAIKAASEEGRILTTDGQ